MASLDEILELGRTAARRRIARAAVERGEGSAPGYQEASAAPYGLAYGLLSSATADPAERAALRMRESVQPSRGRAYSPGLERALRTGLEFAPGGVGPVMAGINAVTGGSPADVGLAATASSALPKWARVLGGIGGMAMEPGEAEAGAGSLVRKGAKKLATGLAKYLTPEGAAIKGPAFEQRMGEVKGEMEGMPKGAGPLDLTGNLRMDVPQRAIPRYEPPQGVSPRMQEALANPDVRKGVLASMKRGVKMGAENWYLNDPVYQSWVKELGPTEGPREFARYMDYVAATSPKSDVPTNIRNASYYYVMGDRPLPEKPPYPYGHEAQSLHRANVAGLQEGERAGGTVGAQFAPEWRGWDVITNPKPPSFSENLQGNLIPTAVDSHAFKNIGMRTGDPRFLETSIREIQKAPGSEFGQTYGEVKPDPKRPNKVIVTYRPQQLEKSGRINMDEALQWPTFWAAKPRENEYGAAEGLYSDLAQRLGLAPGQGQSAAWSGAGELTGLGTPANLTFPEMFNNRVLYTAMMRGENPQDTLRMLIRKQKPLLTGAGATPLAAGMLEAAGQPQENEPTPRARGGDVEPGRSYLVGEEGPEVVVPRQPGTVLAMEDTRDPFNPLGGRMRPGEGGTSRGKNITAEDAAYRVGVADARNKRGVLGTNEAAGQTILDKGTPEVQAAYRRGIEEGLQKYFTPKD
jgi:hypothetical protein